MCESLPEGNRRNAEPRAGGGVEEGRGGGRKEHGEEESVCGVGGETKRLDPSCDGAEARSWEGLLQGHIGLLIPWR